MKWLHSLWRWSSLGFSVAALAGIALAGKHWAEQHAIEAVLGPGTHHDSLTLHWAHSAACADNVRIPLSETDRASTKAQLSARRMWFTYDLPSLLRKRVVLPRVIIEDAHIVSTGMPRIQQAATAEVGAAFHSDSLPWIEQLHEQTAALESEQFIAGTQVARDTAALHEQWQGKFADVHHRARNILAEAKEIQHELAALDNPLRQEAKVLASRGRLETLRAELAGLKNALSKADKVLRDQQSRIRETLLIEKRSLREAGAAFQLPPANELAEHTVNHWLTFSMAEPAQYSILLSDLICRPFRHAETRRGENLRHVDPLTTEFAAMSAKIAGDISISGPGTLPVHRAPFTASGSFAVLPCGSAKNVAAGQRSRWQMSVGRSLNCISLEGRSLNAHAGIAQISLESSAAGQIEATCEVDKGTAAGNAKVRLRQWLGDRSHVTAVNQRLNMAPLVQELLEIALSDLEPAPKEIDFLFKTEGGATRVTFDEEGTQWLADGLTRAASSHVAEKYDSAIEKLDAHVSFELQAMNRALAVSHNAETQHLQQLLQEMKVLQAEVINSLSQRSGAEFARRASGDTVR